MKRYAALLRDINIDGKNKIPMSELKKEFEKLTKLIDAAMKNQFGFNIPVLVISKNKLGDILDNAPNWWGNDKKEIYDNLIFMMLSITFSDVYNEIGAPKEEWEKIKNYNEVIFWFFSRKDYQKTNWWSKTASASIRIKLTIRTANTVKK